MNIDNMTRSELERLMLDVKAKIDKIDEEDKILENFYKSNTYKGYLKRIKELTTFNKVKKIINIPVEITINPELDLSLDISEMYDYAEIYPEGKSLYKGTKKQNALLKTAISDFCKDLCVDLLEFFPEVQQDIKNRIKALQQIDKEIKLIHQDISLFDL